MNVSTDLNTGLTHEDLIECDVCEEIAAVQLQGKVVCQNCHITCEAE